MPSSYTEHGLTKQAPGENENTWGDINNENVLELIDDGIFGRCAFTLSGPKTLTNTNGVVNEARNAVLHVTGGTGGTVTVPTLSKIYMVINEASGDVTITAGAGTATLIATEVAIVVCDGTDVFAFGVGGQSWKTYVDGLSFAAVGLPGQAGNAGKFLGTDGSTPGWNALTRADISDLSAALAADIWFGSGGKVMEPDALFAAQVSQAVAFAGTIALDGEDGINFHLSSAMNSNATLANPVNFKSGQSGRFRGQQDATGGRTLAKGSNWIGPSATAGYFPIPTTANAKFRIDYYVHVDGTVEYAVSALS